LLVFAAAASAQTNGSIASSVVDAQLSVIPGASIRLFLPAGEEPIAQTRTSSEGIFALTGLRPQLYDLEVAAPGFQTETIRGVKVDAARETSLPRITLEVGAVTLAVEVNAEIDNLQLNSSSVSVTIDSEQIRRLPLLDRNPLRLIATQAGVGNNHSANTVINGQRSSFTNITFDGVNIQDNFARSNGVDFTPNFLVLDQVAELTVTTSNSDSSVGGGASQVNYVSPSGTNSFHGTAYWSHRNNKLAANDWFANADGLERPNLAQNQWGGTLSGPIRKDKLLFFQSFEIFRLPGRRQRFRTILTEDARRGIFSYVDAGGAIRKFDPREAGLPLDDFLDPVAQGLLDQVPGPSAINNFRFGDSSEGRLLNTAGYSFFADDDLRRINSTSRIDYILSARHAFTVSLNFSRLQNDAPELANDYSEEASVVNTNAPKLVSGNWRWNPFPSFTNEVRGAFNLAPIRFESQEAPQDFVINPDTLLFSNPVNLYATEARDVGTYHLLDNGSWFAGKHHVEFGYQTMAVQVESFDEINITPAVNLRGVSITDVVPGLTVEQANTAAFLYAALFGNVNSVTQRFNVRDRQSGLLPRQPRVRRYRTAAHSLYLQDAWRVAPRFTLNLGVRYELWKQGDESDGLALLPVGAEDDPLRALLSNSTLDFAGRSLDRPFHELDRNNFAPRLGFAWDLFGTAQTVLRGGFSTHFVNDEILRSASFVTESTEGLFIDATVRAPNQGSTTLSEISATPIETPELRIPRTLSEGSQAQTIGAVDPQFRAPFVMEWNFGVQQKVADMVVEARYVGNRGIGLARTLDFNAPILRENGFLDAFLLARSNGRLAQNATGFFDPTYDPLIPGSRPLPFFAQLGAGGALTNPTVRELIQTGQPGDLAFFYSVLGLNGPVQFVPNPLALSAYYLTNASSSSYHAFHLDVRRRLRRGLQYQGNYVFSKVLTDAQGTDATRFDPYLDPRNGSIEKARAAFDLNHAIKSNFIWELPLWPENKQDRAAALWLGGWSLSGMLTFQSGAPFSIVSERATTNTSSYSMLNTVDTALDKNALEELRAVRSTGTGPSIFAAEAIGPDGLGSRSLFGNPEPGLPGALQRRILSGPWTFNLDFAVLKTFRLSEARRIEFRGEAANVFNNTSWVVGDQNINSPQFGRITRVAYDSRRIQLGLYYRF